MRDQGRLDHQCRVNEYRAACWRVGMQGLLREAQEDWTQVREEFEGVQAS